LGGKPSLYPFRVAGRNRTKKSVDCERERTKGRGTTLAACAEHLGKLTGACSCKSLSQTFLDLPFRRSLTFLRGRSGFVFRLCTETLSRSAKGSGVYSLSTALPGTASGENPAPGTGVRSAFDGTTTTISVSLIARESR
jgi:hypothetical protein